MAEDEIENEAVAEEVKGGLGKKLAVVGVSLALLAIGGFGGMAVMNSGSPEGSPPEPPEPPASSKPALYTSLQPPLVVNFDDAQGATHFMQITMDVMSRDQKVINAVREHTPVIRNNLILLYGNSVYEEVTTREGKEQMLADGLAEIQKVMQQQIGTGGVEAVYFTSLIIQ